MVSRFLGRLGALLALYVSATWFAEAFILGTAQVTIFWPAAGVALAAVIRFGWGWSLFIIPAVLLAHGVVVPVPDAFLPYSLASNFLGALAGAYVARGRPLGMNMETGFAVLRGALVMATLAAGIGTFGLVYAGMVEQDAAASAFVKWALGDLLGILCVAPTLLLATALPKSDPDEPVPQDYPGRGELRVWCVVLALSFLAVLMIGQRGSQYALGMAALPLTVLLWSAFRFSPLVAAAGTAVSVLFLTSLMGLGVAGFQAPVLVVDALLLLGFMILFASVPLVVSALVHQQRILSRRTLRMAMLEAAQQRELLEELVEERTRELAEANAKLETISQTDPLTGLRNRRFLDRQLEADLAFYDREQSRKGPVDALVFALLDIDHFKQLNDTHGHAAGDLVLQEISSMLRDMVRSCDYVVRWGGEEFLLVFRPIAREHVPVLGERLRAAVAGRACDIGGGQTITVTGSIGLAEYPLFRGDNQAIEWERMVELADAALYWVKENGRDGWAALRPTPATDIQSVLGRLKEGADSLVAAGQLTLISGKVPGAAAKLADPHGA